VEAGGHLVDCIRDEEAERDRAGFRQLKREPERRLEEVAAKSLALDARIDGKPARRTPGIGNRGKRADTGSRSTEARSTLTVDRLKYPARRGPAAASSSATNVRASKSFFACRRAYRCRYSTSDR
jgi:hypothetical protein